MQAHMVRRMQRLVAWGWAAAPRHPGMRPPEGTPGITKLRWGTASFRAANFFGRPDFLEGLSKASHSELASVAPKDRLHVQRPLHPGDVPIAI